MAAAALGTARVRSALIVGAGVGGLTTAHALKQRGIAVTVLERAKGFESSVGAAFSLSVNGQLCLDSLGLTPTLQPLLNPFRQLVVLRPDTQQVWGRTSLERLYDNHGFYQTGVQRSDLIGLLADPLAASGELHYGHKIVHVHQDGDGARVHVEGGRTFEADLVVGADGVNSTVGAHVLGAGHDDPVFSSENVFYGIIDRQLVGDVLQGDVLRPENLVVMYGRGEFVAYALRQDARFWVWAHSYRCSTPPSREEWGAETGQTEELLERLILSHYPADSVVRTCAQYTAPGRLLHFGLFWRRHKATWHRGRVCLLGDACHATLPYVGQGANLAIEDAVVLASALQDNDFVLAPSLEEYYAKRHKRTKRMVDMARLLGYITHAHGGWRGLLRDMFVRHTLLSDGFLAQMEAEIADNSPVPSRGPPTR